MDGEWGLLHYENYTTRIAAMSIAETAASIKSSKLDASWRRFSRERVMVDDGHWGQKTANGQARHAACGPAINPRLLAWV